MHIAGIVAEYNPFHNGHLYQIEKTKQMTGCDFIIVVMSGHFSQRGQATLADKFTRTQMALSSGADLVLELPVPYATGSAERFAQAAISLLHQTGLVNTLSFGSECGDIGLLTQIAEFLETPPPSFDDCLKAYLKEGLSFPQAREKAILNALTKQVTSPVLHQALSNAVSSPNNILGIEYIKAILHYNASIKPFTVLRMHAGYHDLHIHSSIASATAIRSSIYQNNSEEAVNCMPPSAYSLLVDNLCHKPDMDELAPFLHYKLMFTPKESLYSLWDIPKELIHSLINYYPSARTYTDWVKIGTSKTYSAATVQRALLRLLLDFDSLTLEHLNRMHWIPYIRVLGCKKESTLLLKHLVQNAHVPVITNVRQGYNLLDSNGKALFDYELKATKLYHYLCHQPHLYQQDFTHPFTIL